jgi:hypothetical protein
LLYSGHEKLLVPLIPILEIAKLGLSDKRNKSKLKEGWKLCMCGAIRIEETNK